jgi:hypothetical protein
VNYITIMETNLDVFPFAYFVTSENSTKRNCHISAFEAVVGT